MYWQFDEGPWGKSTGSSPMCLVCTDVWEHWMLTCTLSISGTGSSPVCLVCTDAWEHWVLAVPSPSLGPFSTFILSLTCCIHSHTQSSGLSEVGLDASHPSRHLSVASRVNC